MSLDSASFALRNICPFNKLGCIGTSRYKKIVQDCAPFASLILGQTYEQKRMYPEAIAAFQAAVRLSKDDAAIGHRGNALAIAGRNEDALRVLGDLQRISKERHVSPYSFALLYVGLGDKDRAFEWLERAYAERSPKLVYLKVEPTLDPLRSDARFDTLMMKMGLNN